MKNRWILTFVFVSLLCACSDADPSEPRLPTNAPVSPSGVTNPGEGILGRTEDVDWPVESPALREMIEALPEELGGFERTAARTFGDAAVYPDTSPGAPPYAGITISVIDPLTMEGLTSDYRCSRRRSTVSSPPRRRGTVARRGRKKSSPTCRDGSSSWKGWARSGRMNPSSSSAGRNLQTAPSPWRPSPGRSGSATPPILALIDAASLGE